MKGSPMAQTGLVEVQYGSADPRWVLATRIASSGTFAKSARLPKFLLYVCECSLSGREGEVNEQQIGIHVFGRAPGYNSNEDSVVRSQARLLRSRLDSYFQTEGRQEPLIIRVPKGSYVPKFEPRETMAMAAVAERPASAARRWRRGWLVVALMVLLPALTAAAVYWRAHQSATAGLWAQMFPEGRPTLFVADDTALVLVQAFTHKTVDLKSYLSRNYLEDTGNFPTGVGVHRYTNMTDLNFFARLSRIGAFRAEHTFIRYARDLQMADLRGANLVISGARRANPWVELFDQKNNFQGLFSEEQGDYIRNRAPGDGEQAVYGFREPGGGDRTYGLISFVPGITGDESVLMLGGLDAAGTEGAANFLFSGGFEDFLRSKVGVHRAVRHFEILLRMGKLNGSAQRTEVVAYRVHED
jgi:hypothetical protein